ncbi:MAG: ABC transporter ATP-binding protein [Nitrospinota bacterium]
MAFVEVRGLVKRFGAETAVEGVSFGAEQGKFVTLLGPSGCGKTTTLRCIAGLERPDEGEVFIEGECMASPARGVFLPPEQRNLGMVFQSYAVWPHMTVFSNVAYGLRVRRMRRAEAERRVGEVLKLVGLSGFAGRYATKLSGGQRQRVALARALVYNPRVLLFDEPLSNLDAKLREQMRLELARLQREIGFTALYVTHDQAEALVLSDTVVVMDRGRLLQMGDPESIYAAPRSRFVADFIGVANLLEARVLEPGSGGEPGWVETRWERPVRLRCRGTKGVAASSAIVVSVRPEDITLRRERPPSGPEGGVNVLEGKVLDAIYLGNFLDCRVEVGGMELRVQLDHYEHLPRGTAVYLTFPAEHCCALAE